MYGQLHVYYIAQMKEMCQLCVLNLYYVEFLQEIWFLVQCIYIQIYEYIHMGQNQVVRLFASLPARQSNTNTHTQTNIDPGADGVTDGEL